MRSDVKHRVYAVGEVGKAMRGNDRRNLYAGVEFSAYVRRHERVMLHAAMATVGNIGGG